MEIFKSALVIGYEAVFGDNASADRFNFLHEIPRRHVMYEIAGLNYRLKPAVQMEFSTDFDKQVEEL